MRHRFELQPGLHLTPIEKIILPLRSRDELPPILAGLQWIFTHPELNEQIFALLEKKILSGKKATGRTGIDRKSTRLNSSHIQKSRMPSSA